VLKFYLTTFDTSGTGYKKISLDNFTASQLNSEINASTLSNTDLAKSSGTCGTFVYDGTSLTNVSLSDDIHHITKETQSYPASYGTDGNLTINGAYEKVVWSGNAIPLTHVNECTITGMPVFNQCITKGVGLEPPMMPASCTGSYLEQ